MPKKSNIRYSVRMPKSKMWWHPLLRCWSEENFYGFASSNQRCFKTITAARSHATHLANFYGSCSMVRYVWVKGKRKITEWEVTR